MKRVFILFLFVSIFFMLIEVMSSVKPVKELHLPINFPTGITFDGKNLWVTDWLQDEIYCIDTVRGNILKKISSPGYWPTGLAFSGNYLWNADVRGGIPLFEYYTGLIYKIDLQTNNIVKIIQSPNKSPFGLTFDGKYLWTVDNKKGEVYCLDPNDGTIIKNFNLTLPAPTGITYDGKYLWITDRINDEIYMVDIQNEAIINIIKAPGPHPSSICFDGKFFWVSDLETKKVYKLDLLNLPKFFTSNPQNVKITYYYTLHNFGPNKLKNFNVYYAYPDNRVNQKIKKINFEPEDVQIIKDNWGQKIVKYTIKDLEPNKNKIFKMTVEAEISELNYFIHPDRVGDLKNIHDSLKIYLKDDEKFVLSSEIIQKVIKEVVGSEKNPYWIARKLYQYVIDKIEYEMAGGWDIAPVILSRGSGSCSEYSFAFIALCRAAGIPARYVGSIVKRKDNVALDNVYHRWVEIFLPNYGWIPVDANAGDSKSKVIQAKAFGSLPPIYLITTQSGGGSNYLEWSYNSNESLIIEPKTFVAFEHFAIWETLK